MVFGDERTSNGSDNVDVDGTIENWLPHFAIAGFNGHTGAKIFYHHQSKFFGEAYAVTYADFGPTGSNLYAGGMVDTCFYASGTWPPCFSLAINRITPAGYNES